MIKAFANRVVGRVKVDKHHNPTTSLHELTQDDQLNVMTLMTMMQLHDVLPTESDIIDLGADPSEHAFLANGFMQGRLRSRDYMDWQEQFVESNGRLPFDSKTNVRDDIFLFQDTYDVPSLGRVSETTLEFLQFTALDDDMRTRNYKLMQNIGCDMAKLHQLCRAPTVKQAVAICVTMNGVGQYRPRDLRTSQFQAG